MTKILAIESSCDETAVAIIEDGKLLSNIVSTQIEVHRKYGGVMPEIASRLHAENISIVLSEALEKANVKLIPKKYYIGINRSLKTKLLSKLTKLMVKGGRILPDDYNLLNDYSISVENQKTSGCFLCLFDCFVYGGSN